MDQSSSAQNLRISRIRMGVEHVMSVLYHPATSGLVETAVQTFKEGVKQLKKSGTLTKLVRFLFSYCITPQSTTGVLSAELMMGRRLNFALDLVKPDLHKNVEQGQEHQKAACDQQVLIHGIKVGDLVYARTYRPGAM